MIPALNYGYFESTARSRLVQVLAMLAIFCAGPLPAQGQDAQPLKGVALVIGQSAYAKLPKLENPAHDATAVSSLLTSLGFEVTTIADRNAKRLRRDLENLASDAEGANIAVVYYSGHGIEAGGEDWLVPVDADPAHLDAPEKSLVPLSGLIDELRASVPLTILFLDACRNNPFPLGTVLRMTDGREVPVAPAGLAPTRGVIPATSASPAGLGLVIAFAAEPGQTALDGPPGGNSPYTAALLKHLGAMDGAELGTVMRMVTEEVYLKTQARQRPWVNESLTQLVYLGKREALPAGEPGRILSERRQLLLSIAALPDLDRIQVEQAAQTAGVPMDALYGLLRALGTGTPSDPEALGRLLNAQAERVKALLAQQASLVSSDPEIARLTDLAREALNEGALEAELSFWEQARARYAEVSEKLDASEAELKARRLEGGAVLAGLAEAQELKADFGAAAESYGLAFAEVEKWDKARAWDYKRHQADAWLSQGDTYGDNAALGRAIAAFEEALSLAPRDGVPDDWALTENNLGNTYFVRGNRSAGNADLELALAHYRAALDVRTRARVPGKWAGTQNNIAIASVELAQRSGDAKLLADAIDAYRAALSETPRDKTPDVWATIASNLANALADEEGSHLGEAVSLHREALALRPRDKVPLDWAGSQTNLANALAALGQAEGDTAPVDEAIAAYRLALEERTRRRMPLAWAAIEYNIGATYAIRAHIDKGTDSLTAAIAAYRLALDERTFEREPLAWAATQYNLGRQSWQLGVKRQDAAPLRDAVQALEASLRVYTRERNAGDWAATQVNLANALSDLGGMTGDADALHRAIAAYHGALEVETRETMALDWAFAQNNLGGALLSLAIMEKSPSLAREARTAVAAAAETYASQGITQAAPLFAQRLVQIDGTIAELTK